ncbi:MAG: hypothetical protein JXR19_02085 [Bacteroidia bacterium]
MKKKDLLIAFIILSLTAVSRIWIPINNFSPIGAMALMGGAFFGRRLLAFALPLLSLFIGDLVLTQVSAAHGSYLFSANFFMVYAAFAVIVLLGIAISQKLDLKRVFGMSLVSAAVFFILTNFGAWLFFGMYPMNIGGLMASFAAGLPFLQNTLISQIAFSVILYFGLQWAFNRKLKLA